MACQKQPEQDSGHPHAGEPRQIRVTGHTRVGAEHSCSVCHAPYENPTDAELCAKQKAPKPRFKQGEWAIYRTVAIRFRTKIFSRQLASTRIGEQKIATHLWFYEVSYLKMGKVLTPETLLHRIRKTRGE